MNLHQAYVAGHRHALEKFALGPPTQVDDFIANVEHAQDVPLPSAEPPMSHPLGETLPALDGTVPLEMQSTSPPTPPGMGSTVGEAPQPPPSMGALGG
jgi:hypothetical protein